MLAQALTGAEPGENDGDAAANGMVGSKAAALAQEQQRGLVPFLEMRYVRPVQIDLRVAPGGGHFEHRQVAAAVQKGHPPENL